MVFGDGKFKKWKKENPEGIYHAFTLAKGSSIEMGRILNDATNNESREQVKKFIKDSKKLGLLT
jgi:hypothetical protein